MFMILLLHEDKICKKNAQAKTVMDDLTGIGDGDDIHDLVKDFKDLWLFLKSITFLSENKKEKWTKQMKHCSIMLFHDSPRCYEYLRSDLVFIFHRQEQLEAGVPHSRQIQDSLSRPLLS